MTSRIRVWRFRLRLWRAHQRIARQLGIRRWRGFSDAEIDLILAEIKKQRDSGWRDRDEVDSV